ncbi:MAG: discoidin domain-containing protein [Flammeovirgaceae bacterium]
MKKVLAFALLFFACISCEFNQNEVALEDNSEYTYTFHYKGEEYQEVLKEGKQNSNAVLAAAFKNPNHVVFVPADDLKSVYIFDTKEEMTAHFAEVFEPRPSDETCSATVTLFEHKDYTGASLRMCNSVSRLGTYNFDDKATSLILSNTTCASNWYIGLYKDQVYGGPAVYFGASTGTITSIRDLNDFKFHNFFGIKYGKVNDKVSSVEFIPDGGTCLPFYQGSTTNFARSGTASASSTFSGYAASKVNDGSRNTTVGGAHSWTNAHTYGSGLGGDGRLPEYVQVTFNGTKNIGMVKLYSSSGYVIRDYLLQYRSTSGAWITLVDQNGNTSVTRTHTFNRVNATAVRIYAERGPNNQSIYARVNELEVY